MFRFLVEEKIKCLATEKVKYTQRVDYIMQLPVPMDAARNKGGCSATPQGLGAEAWQRWGLGAFQEQSPRYPCFPTRRGYRIDLARGWSAELC